MAARPAAAAHARLPGGMPDGDRPSRTSGVGGLHEVVEHRVTGFSHPPDDLAGMAASGVRRLTGPGLYRSVAAAGRRVVVNRFCADRVEPMHEPFYRALGPRPNTV